MGTIISRSPEETFHAGCAAAAALRGGEVLALVGDLGAGKTHWVKGLAAGLGSDAVVTSPTFALIHEYGGGRLSLYHIDCYRLERPEELVAIGIDDYLDGRGVLVIEWADKFPELIPAAARWLRFRIGEGEEREIA
ncbi:MAG TPA: tRNA (adenosine(37)-N6)-threonylcarbamoyltransferase complex ATPase subunit type 1 TsaE [Chthoniobacteraceae bacterium]|jgi:tRNA threonylcarbamoyladenosine biosynthesis protein TsaE|nr:tRNA (adenosine(37)-N6)-threonylcarbamoyltransferase complex ATPase subunit type 1 TsaE [Chthoniobacteraceae bacterium]